LNRIIALAFAPSLLLAACSLERPAEVLPADAGCQGLSPATLDEVWASSFGAPAPTSCNTSGCHASATAAGGLGFDTAGELWRATVNVSSQAFPMPLVTPGDPRHSYLYLKLLPSSASQMPQGGPYLDAAALAQVAGWICAGAPALADGGVPPVDAGFTLTSVTPPSVLAGSGAVTLTLGGTQFTATCVARLDGANLPTALDGGVLLAAVDPAITQVAATHSINVADGTRTTSALPFAVQNPLPALSSLSPNPVATNGAPFTLALAGSGFNGSSRVSFDGTFVATTFVTAAQLQVQVPTLAAARQYPVYVSNPAPGGGQSGTVNLTAAVATGPSITGLSPNPALAASAFTLSVTGAGYTCGAGGSTVLFDGATYTPATCSYQQLTVALPATAAGTYPVVVQDAAGNSNSMSLTLQPPNPIPTLSSLNPDAGAVGSPGLTLYVLGGGFVQGAVANFAGSPRTTTLQSATQLSASLLASDLAAGGSYPVTVTNPPPGGGTSSSLPFTVVAPNPVPTVSGLTPCGAVAGGGTFTLTIAGTGFFSGSNVTFNGTPVTVSSSSSTSLAVIISSSLVATAPSDDAVPVVVTNPAPGGGSATAYYGLAHATSTLSANVQPIFTASCANAGGCHSGNQAPLLTSGNSYNSIVGKPCTECPPRLYVQACGPRADQSYVVAKLTATSICSGTRMPKAQPLTAAQIQLLRDWVAQGAPR